MKIDILANTTDEPRGELDGTSEIFSLSGESSDCETMNATGDIKVIQELTHKLANAETTILNLNEKNKLYEATIKDKNDLIKSLNISIELMKETKELKDQITGLQKTVDLSKNQNKEAIIKQLKDEITDLQNTLDLSKNLTINKDDTNSAKSAEFKEKTIENADWQTLQKQFHESQFQIASLLADISQLKAEMAELKSKIGEKNDEIATLKDKSTTEEDKLRATIADLEKKAKIYEAELKEKDAKIAKYTSNMESCESTDAPIDFLEGSEWPNIKLIKIGDKKVPPLIVKKSGYGCWMVILYRFNGSQDFSMNSCSYEKGFGNVSGEFWLGLESLHQLTSSRRHELFIDIEYFDNGIRYVKYDNFVVGSKEEGYALKSLGNCWGSYNDLQNCIGGQFVYDTSRNYYWWLGREDMWCLTGKYRTLVNDDDLTGGMYWVTYGNKLAVRECSMSIRPK